MDSGRGKRSGGRGGGQAAEREKSMGLYKNSSPKLDIKKAAKLESKAAFW